MPLIPNDGGARPALLGAALVLLGACHDPRPTPQGAAPLCAEGCHGGADSPAPPPGLWLSGDPTSPSHRGVGAHQAHLAGSTFRGPLPCASCHVVPAEVDAAGHMDSPLPAEVRFSPLARGGRREPAADLSPTLHTADMTCRGTYCHALDRAADPAPSWTAGAARVCGDCHGLPPGTTLSGAPHPQAEITACAACHPTVDSAGAIRDRALHINGVVDL